MSTVTSVFRLSFRRCGVLGSALSLAACSASSQTPAGVTSDQGGVVVDGGTPPATSDRCRDPPVDLDTSKRHARTCALGDDARYFVRGAPYANVVVEIGSTKSATPSKAATDHLLVVMHDLLDKSGTITVVVDPPIDDVGHPITLAEAAALEDASRTRFAQADTGVFFYLVVAETSSDDNAQGRILGYAYRPSSMVIFQKTIFEVSGGLGQPSHDIVESTVVAHEFGHILGLVNSGTPMQSPHDDTAHPKHDTNTACLMYWANNSSAGLANLLSGGVIPPFDAACLADVNALKK